MKAGGELVIVATFETLTQASIAKTALVAAGIPAFVPAETAVAPVNRTGSELMFAELKVHAANRERALDILKHAGHR